MKSKDILIIDQDRETGVRLATLVELAGFGTADIFPTAREAAAAMRPLLGERPKPPRIILVDVSNPQGVEAIRFLIDDKLFHKTPILAVAELDEEERLQAIFDAGAADYLPKPVLFPALKVRMRTALRRQKEHERRRVREQELYRILDSMLLHIWILDRQGRIRRANQFTLGYTSLEMDQVQNRTVDELFPGPSAQANHQRSMQVIESGIPLLGMEEVLEVQDNVIHLAVDRIPDLDETGEPRGVLVFAHDITGRKRAEEALKESERRYRTLVDRITVSILEQDFTEVGKRLDELREQGVTDLREHLLAHPGLLEEFLDSVFLFGANEMSLSLLDARNLKELRENMHRVFRPSVCDILLEQLLAIWEGVGRIELKAQVLTIKGKTIHCIVKFFLQESDGGLDLSSMVLALLDITEIKRAEEILKRSEARYRAIVEDQTDLICRYLPDGAISFVNDAYARYFGRGAGDFLGLHFLPPMPREEVEKVTDAVQSLSLDRPVCSVEHRVFRGEEERWQQWTHRAIFDAQGRLMERQAVGQDVTERKRMEHDLKRAMEEARAASTYKSEFLAAVSHEVRTPLTAILGLSEHIMDKGGAEEHLPDLGRIHRAGQNLLQLINEILDLSKIEAGKLEIEYSDFNPHALALEMGEMFLANAESKNLAMDWDIAPEVPDWVHGCEARIRQVLYNLLGNAVKFTDQGSITMGLALDSENTLRFQVTDTGIGIEHDKLSAIFDPYAQEGGFVSRKYGGTGLGLAIAKRLVEMMGGTIQAESQKGEGATFTFTAPVKPAVTSKPERKHGKAVLPSLPALRILIAEDDPTNQIIARRYLEDLDHHVTLVSDGRSAVELYEEREFDLVLMDIQMPELSGTEATRRIRKLEAAQDRPRTPILALTADAMKDNRSKFLDAGMDGYAFKPFDFPKLMVQIQGVMVSLGLIPGAADTPRQGADVSLPGEIAQAPGHTTAPSPNSELLDVAGAPVARKIWLLGAAIFLEDTPEQVEALAELARNGDAPAVKELAHKLKGAAGNVRAVRMQQLAEEIERAGADNDLDAVRKKAALLREAWDGTAIALQREIQAEQ